jgi:hypothetical protein
MTSVILATDSGCRTFTDAGEGLTELAGHPVSALAPEPGGSCLAIIDSQQIWRRHLNGEWKQVAVTDIALQSVTSISGTIFAGGMDEAALFRILPNGTTERLTSFDRIPGRADWFAGGPPLGVRSLATTSDGSAVLAAVHVGGIPRTTDGGETWQPTIPILWDVHEIHAHPQLSNLVAAATAIGLCTSQDGGQSWRIFSEGPETANSLAVAVLENEVLFSIQDGPFATRSQIWRWRIGAELIEQVRDGLPEWLEGKVDTGWIAAGAGRAAIVDRGGNLWLSSADWAGWNRIASGVPYPFGLAIL